MHIFFKKSLNKKGFTLVEVMVSLSIFAMVIVVAVSVLLSMMDANHKAQNIQSVMTNLSFALDSMTREIRMGSNYYCKQSGVETIPGLSDGLPVLTSGTQDCTDSQNNLSFSFLEGGTSLTSDPSRCPNGSNRIAYRFNPDESSIERRICDGDGVAGNNEEDDWHRITSPEVSINNAQFTVSGSDSSDALPPTLTIFIVGEVLSNKQKLATDFAVQTTVTQQLLDI